MNRALADGGRAAILLASLALAPAAFAQQGGLPGELSTVGAVRIDDYKFRFIDQPAGWLGDKTHPDVPYITNLRLDPFERTGWPGNGTKDGAQQYFDWFKFQFWRFVFVQQLIAKEIQTFIEYPPMQRGASFNLDAVKAELAKKMAAAEAASKGTGN